MLLNDITRNDKMNGVHTRDIQNAAVRHHQNNPHVSMETAFEYIMSISSTYRALPIECIKKARKYLALPESIDKSKQMSNKNTYAELNKALQDMSDNNLPLFLMPFRQVITVKENTQPRAWNYNAAINDELCEQLESMGIQSSDEVKIKAKVSGPQVKSPPTYPGEKSMVKPKSKPSTTVVHAERVVVNDKKMIKILEFENVVLRFDLPHEYFSSQPCCWKYKEGMEIKYYDAPHTIHQNVLPGDILSLKDFGQMIKTMKEAGVRLSKINKTAKLEKEHSGKFTVSI